MGTVLVAGSGIAGLVAALKLSKMHRVILVTKGELAESNTLYAQGGIAAVLPGSADVDTIDAHVLDTLRAGAGINEYDAVQALCADGPRLVEELIELGVAFDRSGGMLARGIEAAHSHARILHAGGDATGAAIERALAGAIRRSACEIVENTFLADLVVDDGRVVGADVIAPDSTSRRIAADVVVLASGGAGQLYLHTTNPAVTTGDGIAAAWRAGAQISDVEFFQFHPTALALPGSFLVSEAVRGEGAVLVNEAGERFMVDAHKDAELAPRDVVARAIAVEMAAQGGLPVRLDATRLGGAFLARRFPTIDAATRSAGLDWGTEPIPVTPAAHYWMGGITTDLHARTTLPGLYAVGEVACTGAHGANRLASNSLLEGLVFADRAARDINTSVGQRPSHEHVENEWQGRDTTTGGTPFETAAGGTFRTPLEQRESVVDRLQLQQLMWNAAGVLRSRDSLVAASETLAAWTAAHPRHASIAQREDANLLDLARILVTAALAREESRGAHYRSDIPSTSADFARHLRWRRNPAMHEQEAFAC
jgi:L-aspartate oxidase